MRYKLTVSYDGYNYMGFQIQDDLDTIELEIEQALEKLVGKFVKIYPSGRTDRYVHAKGQVIHFDLDNPIPAIGVLKGLNSFLPADIHIVDAIEVENDFHARFSAKSKEYRYLINTGSYDPLMIRYAPNITNLDTDAMEEAMHLLEGTHDFKGFASASIDERKDTVKTIYSVCLNKLPNDYLEFVFVGSGFLKYQIRRMMGLLIEIGKHKETKEKITEVLEKCDPKISHKVADGCGLYLYKVNY